MEEHAVPRQITTFEFKLIGFMTLKQFLYMLIFVPMAYIIFRLFPIPIVNILLAVMIGGFGVALAFLPLNDRSLDVWIKNLLRRLTSPTQYMYHKENKTLAFLHNLYFMSDPHKVLAHVESQEKLAEYLAKTKQTANAAVTARKQHVQALLNNPSVNLKSAKATPNVVSVAKPVEETQSTAMGGASLGVPTARTPMNIEGALAGKNEQQAPLQQSNDTVITPTITHDKPAPPTPIVPDGKQPYLVGVIKNNKQIPLPGILVYIKDQTQTPLRLLKTNPHGVFATYNPLPQGDYMVEVKDPKGSYFFDTMNFTIAGQLPGPMEIFSKEIL